MGYLENLRRHFGHALLPLVNSTALIHDEAGRLVFQRRTDFNLWGLPGGMLELEESPAECAVREAREETGLTVRPVRLTAVLSSPRHIVLYPNGDRAQQITFCFDCSIEGGSFRAGAGESSALAFYAPDDFPPTLAWYQLMLEKRNVREPFFDQPEFSSLENGSPGSSTWSALRAKIGSAPLILPGATALIRDPRGRVFLVRRMDSGLWSPPGGLSPPRGPRMPRPMPLKLCRRRSITFWTSGSIAFHSASSVTSSISFERSNMRCCICAGSKLPRPWRPPPPGAALSGCAAT